MSLIHIGGKSYELIHENRNGWNPEAFRNRYSEVLERYDYIIGDWGYNQLRLKGFFKDNHQKATKDSTFSAASDYINEYCNFGCAYFILEKKLGDRREPNEEDLDLELDYGDDSPRIEGYDLRAAAQSAFTASASVEDDTVEAPPQAVKEHIPSQSSQNRHRHNPNQRGERADGQGRRREQNNRSKSHRGGNDHRGKKPIKLAASEAAAASEPSRGPIPKDAGRS